VGVSVSSKIGNSVVRHKIKRQVVSMLDKCVYLDDSIDLVVIVKMNYLNFTYDQNYDFLEKNIKYILKKGATINEK
jgi:ribonuclease P protein component